jgi:hypothetical protein
MPTASLGGTLFPLNPQSVAWRYMVKTAVQTTLGGKVIQAYGTAISDITLSGSFGKGGTVAQQAFFNWIKSLVTQQIGNLTPHQGQGIWNGQPLRFLYPDYGWDMQTYITTFRQPNSESQMSIEYEPSIVNYQWTLGLFVVDDQSTPTIAGPSDAGLIQFVNQLAETFGWFPTQYNGPVVAGQYPTLVSTGSSSAGTGNPGTGQTAGG